MYLVVGHSVYDYASSWLAIKQYLLILGAKLNPSIFGLIILVNTPIGHAHSYHNTKALLSYITLEMKSNDFLLVII